MAKKLSSLSIFFPFWNEEENIREVVSRALSIAPKVADKWEIIMVDDGSSDRTLEIADALASRNKNLKVVSLHPNRGYGAALKAGFENSRYDYIVFTDGDLQFDFSEVGKFIEKIDKADIVIGYRKKRRDQKILKRLLLMNLLKIGDFILFGFTFRDIDCGFKMFRKSAVSAIFPLRSEGAMITTEILAKAIRKKLRITEVGVEHYKRLYGVQTGANIPVIVRAILESLTLWLDIRNKRI
jgi:glycosyltransferase involved in cell wall biosynthesis